MLEYHNLWDCVCEHLKSCIPHVSTERLSPQRVRHECSILELGASNLFPSVKSVCYKEEHRLLRPGCIGSAQMSCTCQVAGGTVETGNTLTLL